MLAPPPKPDFDAMHRAIEEAREVPELVHIIAQAKASRAYYKQAKDAENSWQSFRLQLRAERKTGQLLIEMNEAGVRTKGRAVPGFKVGSPTGQPTLAQLGVSTMESQTWQQLANVPAPAFEAALADPTAARIIRANAATPGCPKAREGVGEAKIHSIALSSISISNRVRALRPEAVDAMAGSMRDRGLLSPITVRPLEEGKYPLITGHHRYEAARKLGWENIPAIIRKGLDAVEAELCEIDENLIRADLTPAEQAAHHRRRKELYELKHPETKRAATLKRGQEKAPSRQNGETENRYSKDTAEKTGASERTVQRHVERGTSIPNVSELSGTCLDQGAELDALAKLKDSAPDRQAKDGEYRDALQR
jgi:ParB/RepB/Spo0J family partition protein